MLEVLIVIVFTSFLSFSYRRNFRPYKSVYKSNASYKNKVGFFYTVEYTIFPVSMHTQANLPPSSLL